jgi:long-chain acyl-CoA synthetase
MDKTLKPVNSIEIVIARMRHNRTSPAMFWQGKEYNYSAFFEMIDAWQIYLTNHNIGQSSVCGVLGDYSPQTCALFFALMQANAIIVPFTRNIESEMPVFMEIAGVQNLFRFDTQDGWTLTQFDDVHQAELVILFHKQMTPGLIVFTSGSTGKPKGILHNIERVMHKFVAERAGWRTILFLMMDHFGGFNTMLSTFAYSGTGLCISDRSPETVCRVIEKGHATLLPTTPTFLNLLIASGSYRGFDLSPLKLITYGTEVMSESTLQKARTIFPNAQIKQTYGLSELGVLRSKSESDDSVWVKIGGDGFEVKVLDGLLWVRSEANMVGYLNAPSPFDSEGWLCTGDRVEVNGDYIRFMGRQSEMINVGGQKVFPVEVENILLQAENVQEAAVYGVKHPLLGQVVHARISLYQPEDVNALNNRLRKFCLEHLARYKMPTRFIVVAENEQHSERYKKIRRLTESGEKKT